MKERALKYKTSRISYITSYFLVIFVLLFFLFLLPYIQLNELLFNITTLICLSIISFLVLEPEWEKVVREYQITNNEVTKIEGIITKKIISIPHLNIADLTFTKGVIGRIFNFGDVEVKGYKNSIKIKGVRNPEEIYRIIKNKVALAGSQIKEKTKEQTKR